jgi:hypothetical protein
VTTNEILTLIALLAGPVAAVIITRYQDDQRQYHGRRMDIFRTLMRTRRAALSPDHIGALNLVEIEFADEPTVVRAWKELFTHFGTAHGHRVDENIEGLTDQKEIERRNEAFAGRLIQERQRLLAKLLHAIAKVLGFKIEQLEIFEGGYTPQFWADIETEQAIIRKFVVDLAYARKVVPMGVIDYRSADKIVADAQETVAKASSTT